MLSPYPGRRRASAAFPRLTPGAGGPARPRRGKRGLPALSLASCSLLDCHASFASGAPLEIVLELRKGTTGIQALAWYRARGAQRRRRSSAQAAGKFTAAVCCRADPGPRSHQARNDAPKGLRALNPKRDSQHNSDATRSQLGKQLSTRLQTQLQTQPETQLETKPETKPQTRGAAAGADRAGPVADTKSPRGTRAARTGGGGIPPARRPWAHRTGGRRDDSSIGVGQARGRGAGGGGRCQRRC